MSDLKRAYIDVISRLEHLHRLLIDSVKAEFDAVQQDDINPVQALLLFNLWRDVGAKEVTAGELRRRGHYHGSNASYNSQKLYEGGYLSRTRSITDQRVVRVKLTEKGREVAEIIDDFFERQLHPVGEVTSDLLPADLETLNTSLNQLERFWTLRAQIDLGHLERTT